MLKPRRRPNAEFLRQMHALDEGRAEHVHREGMAEVKRVGRVAERDQRRHGRAEAQRNMIQHERNSSSAGKPSWNSRSLAARPVIQPKATPTSAKPVRIRSGCGCAFSRHREPRRGVRGRTLEQDGVGPEGVRPVVNMPALAPTKRIEEQGREPLVLPTNRAAAKAM